MLAESTLCAFIPALDAAKAKQFYQEILGLSLIAEDGFALQFESNCTPVRVTPVREFTPHPFTVLGWQVKGIEKIVKGLTEKGVLFEKYSFIEQDENFIWTAPGGTKVAWFKDPDGNLLSLSEHP